MTVITDTDALSAVCAEFAKEDFVTIDTEFMREKTYYPQLCLVQLGIDEKAVAIDTLAEGLDLAPLVDLLKNRDVLKVFHAARQDLEIFYHLCGELPAPVFDTQVAGMICGFGDSVSYDKLVQSLTGVQLDKSSRFADWSHRPLSEKQIGYALADVIHLRPVYRALVDSIEKSGRAEWIAEEVEKMSEPALYDPDPDTVWQRLKVRSGKPKFLAVLQQIAAFREREARQRDVPRNRILRDDVLMDIAARRVGPHPDLQCAGCEWPSGSGDHQGRQQGPVPAERCLPQTADQERQARSAGADRRAVEGAAENPL